MYAKFSAFLVLSQLAGAEEECYKNGAFLYEDMACDPVNSTEGLCPTSYNCSDVYMQSGCTYKGQHYLVGEVVENNLTESACCANCRCFGLNHFVCEQVACYRGWWWWNLMENPNCYTGYVLGKCCSSGQICPPTNQTERKTCEVDGKIYKLGEKFVPKDTCLTCVCHENFTGEFDGETCMEQNCNIQITYAYEIGNNCAPAYFSKLNSTILCCPDCFICPSYKDNIKVLNSSPISDLECIYGNKKIKSGYGFYKFIPDNVQDKFLKCECILPPLLTCTEM